MTSIHIGKVPSTSRVLWYLMYMCVWMCTCEFFEGADLERVLDSYLQQWERCLPARAVWREREQQFVPLNACCSLQYGIAFTLSQSLDFCPVIRSVSSWWSALVGWRVSELDRLIGTEPKKWAGSGWALNIHEERDHSTRRKAEWEGIERKTD